MSINYIISTYNGKNKRNHSHPLPKDIVKEHLKKILSLECHLIKQITIMKANSDNYYDNYYDIDNEISQFKIPVKIINVENYGYSMGQWLKAYEIFKNEFEYFLFTEDDYCGGMDNFDKILLTNFKEKFPEQIGVLCSLVEGTKNYKINKGNPIHFEGSILINNKTLEKLYSNPQWENNPRKYIDLIDHTHDPYFNWNWQRQSYLGGYYQIVFSHLFTLSDIEHEDYLGTKDDFQFPYWQDNNCFPKGGQILFYDKGDISRTHGTLEQIKNSPIIPIQLKDIVSINYNFSK